MVRSGTQFHGEPEPVAYSQLSKPWMPTAVNPALFRVVRSVVEKVFVDPLLVSAADVIQVQAVR